jgi:hypothetical protein
LLPYTLDPCVECHRLQALTHSGPYTHLCPPTVPQSASYAVSGSVAIYLRKECKKSELTDPAWMHPNCWNTNKANGKYYNSMQQAKKLKIEIIT